MNSASQKKKSQPLSKLLSKEKPEVLIKAILLSNEMRKNYDFSSSKSNPYIKS